MRYQLGDWVLVNVAAFDAPRILKDCCIMGRIMDALPNATEPKRYLVGTLAKQFAPQWIELHHITGRV